MRKGALLSTQSSVTPAMKRLGEHLARIRLDPALSGIVLLLLIQRPSAVCVDFPYVAADNALVVPENATC